MRKILWIILEALLVAISAPNVHAQTLTYAIKFTETTPAPYPQGPVPSYGYFVYNPTTNQFLTFVVSWDGLVFDLTPMANNPSITAVLPCLSGATGARATFAFMTGCSDTSRQWFGGDAPRFGFVSLPGGDILFIGFRPDASINNPSEGFCVGDCTGGDFSVSQMYTGLPVGGAYGHIIRLVAGPVRVPPWVPVELNLGFVDNDGKAIGPKSTITLRPDETATLDLDIETLLKRPGERVEVRPVVTVANVKSSPRTTAVVSQETYDRARGPAFFLPTVTEVFDRSTGFGTVVASDNTVSLHPPAFDFQGLAGGQTMRLMVDALPLAPCEATVSFADRAGKTLGKSQQVKLAPDTAMPVNLNADSLGLKSGERIEVLPTVSVSHYGAAPAFSFCRANVEVFDNRTGRTWTYQSGEGHPPPNDYGCGYNKYCREISHPK
jgi:hypothetical protein